MTTPVEYEKRGKIGVITLNNPPVNALSVNKGVVQGILDALKIRSVRHGLPPFQYVHPQSSQR